jgi:hypothetical protein
MKQNNTTNNNNNKPTNHDGIALLSCAIKYKKIEQMVKMFGTHCCTFNFDVLTVVLSTLIGSYAIPM